MEHYEFSSERAGKEISPPCSECFPGVDPDNSEAWEVFQLASSDPWGIGPTGVIQVCKVLEVGDIQECLFKVLRMAQILGAESSTNKPSSKEEPQIG